MFYYSFDFGLAHNCVLLLTAFMWVFGSIWMYRVIIIVFVLIEIAHYFGSGKCTLLCFFAFRSPRSVRVYRLVILFARVGHLRGCIGDETDCVFFRRVFRSIRFLPGVIGIVFWVLGDNFVEYFGWFDEIGFKHLNNNF